MIFKPIHDVTLTEMAQWIDSNSYNSVKDDNKLVEYLYHIVDVKAKQCGFFTDPEKYDDFAIYCVSKFLIRFANTDKPPVKSVLNYLQTVINLWYAEYVREFCSGSADASISDFDINDFSDYLIDSASEYDYINYGYFDSTISKVVTKYLSRIPIKKNSPEWSNICISCFLTLIDRINYASEICERMAILENSHLVNRIIRELKTKPPVIFHIEEEKSAYISVLVNEIIHAITVELTHYLHSKVSISSCLHNLVKAANNQEDN